jgi:transcription termination factor NusA
MPEHEESPSAELQRKLHIHATLADRLVAGNATSVEEVAYWPLAELLEVSGLSPEQARELRRIARLYLRNDALPDDVDDLTL